MKYYQCKLSKGSFKTDAWIEERAAKVGAQVEVLTLPGNDRMWHVDQVFVPGIDEELFKERQFLQRKWHNNI